MLQRGDVNQQDLPKDTVLRSYAPETFDYKVQPNDILSVRFESLTDEKYDFLARNYSQMGGAAAIGGGILIGDLVDNEGQIPFPFIGKVKVAGMTVFQIQDTLQQIAEKYLQSPTVKVRLMNFRFTMLGEVPREGTINLGNNRVTMLEAISEAGGLGELSDRSNIKLLRQRGGKTEVVYLNLLDENFIHSPYYYVYQNDVLIVPPLRQRPFRRYAGQNLSLVISTISLLLLAFNLTR